MLALSKQLWQYRGMILFIQKPCAHCTCVLRTWSVRFRSRLQYSKETSIEIKALGETLAHVGTWIQIGGNVVNSSAPCRTSTRGPESLKTFVSEFKGLILHCMDTAISYDNESNLPYYTRLLSEVINNQQFLLLVTHVCSTCLD
jgi:hypothetical protein